MSTYLIGGLIFFSALFSLIIPSEIIKIFEVKTSAKDFVTLYSPIFIAVASIPFGYMINQIWMVIFNVFFDFHRRIFKDLQNISNRLEKLSKKKFWTQSYLAELRLVFSHRKSEDVDSERYIQWYRNRLNTFHSNGTIVFSLSIGLLTCFLVSQLNSNTSWIIHPFTEYLSERWWFLAIIILFLTSSLLRIIRTYKLIILYNQVLLHDECLKCGLFCKIESNEK